MQKTGVPLAMSGQWGKDNVSCSHLVGVKVSFQTHIDNSSRAPCAMQKRMSFQIGAVLKTRLAAFLDGCGSFGKVVGSENMKQIETDESIDQALIRHL